MTRSQHRRNLFSLAIIFLGLALLIAVCCITAEERASRNVYERNRTGVTGALYRLPDGD